MPEDVNELQWWLSDRVLAGLAVRGESQADLARTLGISQKHLSGMLTGRVLGSLDLWNRMLWAVDSHVVA